jgi:Uma2 family endonuclease
VSVIDLSMLESERLRPLRRVEYDRLVEQGFFEDEKIELLYGMLVEMSPQGAGHAYVMRHLNEVLVPALRGRALVQIQSPLAVSDDSEPEPDVAIVPKQDYSRAHPTSAFLVVEVAETSLRKDRLVKAALYARSGVAEYWIVNLRKRVVEVHRGAGDAGYVDVTTHGEGDVLRPQAFDDVAIPVTDVLPRAE